MKPSDPAASNPNPIRTHITHLARLLALHPESRDVMLAAANAALQAFSPTRNLILDGDYLVVRALGATTVTEVDRLLIQAKQEDVNHGDEQAKMVDSSGDERVAFLHDEVFFTILTRLPADCLYGTMRYVCNTWERIIRNPHFVEAQLQQSKPGLLFYTHDVILDPPPGLVSSGVCFLEFKENGDFEITQLDQRYPGKIESSCDGLVVFCHSFKVLYVANPIIMDVLQVPLMEFCKNIFCCCIARLPNNGGFKLFCSYAEDKGLTSWCVLALGIDNSWRKLGSHFSTSSDMPMNPIPIGQFIYWTPDSDCIIDYNTIDIVINDIVEESMSTFSFPINQHLTPLYFVEIGNSLCYVETSESRCDIYVAKDVYIGGWELYHQIDLNVGNPKWATFFKWHAEPVACIGQELVFLLMKGAETVRCFAYNMKTRSIRILDGYVDGYDTACLHTNSLVSCNSF